MCAQSSSPSILTYHLTSCCFTSWSDSVARDRRTEGTRRNRCEINEVNFPVCFLYFLHQQVTFLSLEIWTGIRPRVKLDTALKSFYTSKDLFFLFFARSKDLSHAEDLQKTPSNPQGRGAKYRVEEGKEAGTDTHTRSYSKHTHSERRKTHWQGADCGGKVARQSSTSLGSQMAFYAGRGRAAA